MEEFNDQPNGICLECWKKTNEFDKFYKSVQAAHLTLLSTKYKVYDQSISDQNVVVKNECADTIINSLSVYDHTEENLASKHEADDDFGQDNGKYINSLNVINCISYDSD